MKKQIEVGYIYPTQDGHGEVQILCTDLTEGFSVLGIRTDKHGGKHLYRCNSAGKCHYESIYGGDLILPDAEPEYRPWTFDEVPVGAVISDAPETHQITILAKEIKEDDVYVTLLNLSVGQPLTQIINIPTDRLMEFNYRVLINGTWQPCGVQI